MGDRHERELKVKQEIRQRLASICSNLTPGEFDELIEKIATNQLKGENRPLKTSSASRGEGRAATGLKFRH